MQVAFIGHRKIEKTEEVRQRIIDTVSELINEGADTFLFGSRSQFDEICYEVLTEIQKTYPQIRRVEVRASNEYLHQMYIDITLKYYEETIFPKSVSGAGYRSYIKRNEAMVDMCDVLVIYYDVNYKPTSKTKSGTKISVEYARKKNKRIINVFK